MLGLTIVAVSDSKGGVYNENGIDPDAAARQKQKTGSVVGLPETEPISGDDVLSLDVTVLLPAALENAITAENVGQVQAKIVAELANGPTTPEADITLHERGVYVLPDFLCNAGGVTVSYFEQVQNAYSYYWPLNSVHDRLAQKMKTAFQAVSQMAETKGVHNRLAAYLVAVERVAEATKLRGWV